MKYLLVFSTVLITILTSVLLDEAAARSGLTPLLLILCWGFAVALNGGKFILWGFIHKHYELSSSYPITALFFPLLMILSYFREGEAITLCKIVGVLLIFFGLILMEAPKKEALDEMKAS